MVVGHGLLLRFSVYYFIVININNINCVLCVVMCAVCYVYVLCGWRAPWAGGAARKIKVIQLLCELS